MVLDKQIHQSNGKTGAMLKQNYPPMEPAAICIGAQKAGTTALYHYLSCHPDVAPSKIKEIDYFNCNSRFSLGIDFYHSQFPDRNKENSGRITFDITPGYLGAAEHAAGRIHNYNPDIRLIALLRNPVTRAHSAWQMYRIMHANNPDWFYAWWRRCDTSIKREFYVQRPPTFGENFQKDIIDEMEAIQSGRTMEMPILLQGMYQRHLKYFYDLFPHHQIHVISTENMKQDTKWQLRLVEAFVELEPHAWTREELEPHFVGTYETNIDRDDYLLLKSFYRDQNRALFDLLQKEFPWD